MTRKRISFILTAIVVIFLTSCSEWRNAERLNLAGSFSWMPVYSDDSLEYAQNHPEEFKTFTAFGDKRIYDLTKNQYPYLWLKANFTIPEHFKNQTLGLIISYLHFADKLWLNGSYIDGYGEFGPNPLSAFYKCQIFNFPLEMLNQEGENSIFIKVALQGTSGISHKIFITDYNSAKRIAEIYNFFHSKLYIFFEGGLFCTFLIFIFFFLWIKKPYYFSFAMMNFWSLLLITTFFATENPMYISSGIPFLIYIKTTFCCSFYFVFYYAVNFITRYMEIQMKKSVFIAQNVILLVQLLVTLFVKSFSQLMALTPYMAGLILIQVIYIFVQIIIQFHSENKRIKRNAKTLLLDVLPLTLCFLIDVVLRGFYRYSELPLFTILGLQFSIIFYIYVLVKEVNVVYNRNQYLNSKLKNEVQIQTRSLSEANQKLAAEMKKSKLDLEMASLVQQKFMPSSQKQFRGWNLANCYESCDVVSGDLFDYYVDNTDENHLIGAGLFDVSGHGLSSGLITMLARDIIFRSFHEGWRQELELKETLNLINEAINNSKGDVDNYLTGILIKFGNFNQNDQCEVELVNAGHPYPFVYRSESGVVEELKPADREKYFGVIGIKDVDVSYSSLNFNLGINDSLICFTDGITEAMDEFHSQFGKKRLIEAIKKNGKLSASEMVEEIKKEVIQFIGQAPREDDITLLVFKREDSVNFIEEL